MSHEAEFEDIAEEVSSRAARVECGVRDYQEGLGLIIERLETDLKASQDFTRNDDEG